MASNSFGNIFRITTWGESHGRAVGAVIDGCPAGIPITEEEINAMLARRAPGANEYTSPRKEKDLGEIYSGVFEGVTTGAPISIIIHNKDADSSKYEPIKNLLRPGHANFTYLEKYGVFDYRGGGRSSARETACRVAAAAVARKLLAHYKIDVLAHLCAAGSVAVTEEFDAGDLSASREAVFASPVFAADPKIGAAMMEAIAAAKVANDSLGGVVEFIATGVPVGLGDPVYEKLEANLARAMLSLPASKGFEIGRGFGAAAMQGSQHNDAFTRAGGQTTTRTNNAGGTLGGISTGQPIIGRVAFKPTSSIMIPQETVTQEGKEATFELPQGSRHDPCVAIRAVPVVEAMCLLVLADALLMNRAAQLEK